MADLTSVPSITWLPSQANQLLSPSRCHQGLKLAQVWGVTRDSLARFGERCAPEAQPAR